MSEALLRLYRRVPLLGALYLQYVKQPGSFWFFQAIVWAIVLVWIVRG